MLGMLYHFLRGTPFIFQGEEIGMTNWRFSKEEADDVEFWRTYHDLVEDKKVMSHEEFMETAHRIGRDNARTPVQWNSAENAGFSRGKPWIPVNKNYKEINVEDQEKDPGSVLNFYKRIIKTRKEHEKLIDGDFELIFEEHLTLLGYKRFIPGHEEVYFAFSNFSNLNFEVCSSHEFYQGRKYEVVLSNYDGYHFDPSRVEIRPWLGALVRLVNTSGH